MANLNPDYQGTDELLTMYRAPAGNMVDIKATRAGYLVSKCMIDWLKNGLPCGDIKNYPEDSKLSIGENTFVVPRLARQMANLVLLTLQDLKDLERFERNQHSVSSSASSTVSPPTGNSMYVGMTPDLEVAKTFSGAENGYRIFRFKICRSDLWQGLVDWDRGKESEWLTLGGARIFDVWESEDWGKSFPKSYLNGSK
jgi:hypothetical protein